MAGRPGDAAVAEPVCRLFGGKGGAGKTTLAAATALARAPAWTTPPPGAADLQTWGGSWEQIAG